MADNAGSGPALGCALVLGLILAAPFIVAAIPVLFGAVLGVIAFFLIAAIVKFIVNYIFYG